jgi:hypothetical protein
MRAKVGMEIKLEKIYKIKLNEYAYSEKVGSQTTGQLIDGRSYCYLIENPDGIGEPVGTKRHRHSRQSEEIFQSSPRRSAQSVPDES